MATEVKEPEIEQKENYSSIDYESSSSGKLEVTISKEQNALFVSPGCTDDGNLIHNAEKYQETEIAKKLIEKGRDLKSEIVPGMMLGGIGEIFGYYYLMTKFEIDPRARLDELVLELKRYVFPGEPLTYVATGYGTKHLNTNNESYFVNFEVVDSEGKAKVKNSTISFRAPQKSLSKPGEDAEKLDQRVLTEENFTNYLKAIDYNNEFITPSMFQIASTISRGLLKKAEQMEVTSAAYKKITLRRYSPEFKFNDPLTTWVQETDENEYRISTLNSDGGKILDAKTTIRF